MKSRIEPFHASRISAMARELAANGRSVLHLEFGQPSSGAPRSALAAIPKILEADNLGYWESTPLRSRLAQHYRESYGLDIDANRFVLTNGASSALVLTLSSFFDVGARIAFARPGYVGYRNTVRALNMAPVEVPCGADRGYQLTADAIEALDPAPDGLLIASPANPTGAIIAPEELSAISRVCDRRSIQVISDEIYHGLTYGKPCRSMLEYSPDAFVISSFSKYFCMPGWRLGWLAAPADHVERARAFLACLFLTAPSLSQHVALAAMDAREELQKNLIVYTRNREKLLEALPKMGLNDIAPPDGAFYIYADIRHLTGDSLSFCTQLLHDTGVATGPGVDFDSVEGRHYMRFSFAVSEIELEDAIARLEPWFAEKASLRIKTGDGM